MPAVHDSWWLIFKKGTKTVKQQLDNTKIAAEKTLNIETSHDIGSSMLLGSRHMAKPCLCKASRVRASLISDVAEGMHHSRKAFYWILADYNVSQMEAGAYLFLPDLTIRVDR